MNDAVSNLAIYNIVVNNKHIYLTKFVYQRFKYLSTLILYIFNLSDWFYSK